MNSRKKIFQIIISTLIVTFAVYLVVAAWTEPELAPPSGNLTTPFDLPAGTVLAFASSSVPDGWLECNGATVSRTTYAALFAVVGTSFGTGDGSTSFNVPDLRGQFVRGWDHSAAQDPDAASRTALLSGGATGNNIGSYQTDAFKVHSHGAYGHQYSRFYNGSGAAHDTIDAFSAGAGYTGNFNDGGNETRPENVYLMYIIKY